MHVNKVLIGVDFSERSLAAARWVAARFAPDAELVLLHVIPVPETPHFLRDRLPDACTVVRSMAQPMYGGLRGLAHTLGESRTTVDLRIGAPARTLAMAADEHGADLVCVGPGRKRHGTARFGGSTADRLLRQTRLPVLVASRMPEGPPARILVGVHDRGAADHVVREAWRLAARFEATLEALHVLDERLVAYARGLGEEDERSRCQVAGEDVLISATEAWLGAQLADAGAIGARTTATATFGDAGQAIVARVRRSGAHLVILGPPTFARDGGIRDTGSVIRLVRWVAPCPVLVLARAASRLEVRGDDDARIDGRDHTRARRHSTKTREMPPWPPAA